MGLVDPIQFVTLAFELYGTWVGYTIKDFVNITASLSYHVMARLINLKTNMHTLLILYKYM